MLLALTVAVTACGAQSTGATSLSTLVAQSAIVCDSSAQPATVPISNIQLLTGGSDGTSGNPPTLPSYQITLPLS